MRPSYIVPPQGRRVIVVRRPKTSMAATLSIALGALGVVAGLLHPEAPQLVAPILLLAAAISGVIAVVFRLRERPREVEVYEPSPTADLPVIHLGTSGKSVDSRGSG